MNDSSAAHFAASPLRWSGRLLSPFLALNKVLDALQPAAAVLARV